MGGWTDTQECPLLTEPPAVSLVDVVTAACVMRPPSGSDELLTV